MILVQFTHASVEAVIYSDIGSAQVFQPVSCVELLKIVCGNTVDSLKGMAALVNLAAARSKMPSRPARAPARNARNTVAIFQPVRPGENGRDLSVSPVMDERMYARGKAAFSMLPAGAVVLFITVCMFFFRRELLAWLAGFVHFPGNVLLLIFFRKTLITVTRGRGFQISEAPSCGG